MIIHICFNQIDTASSKCGPFFHLHLWMRTVSEQWHPPHKGAWSQGGLGQWWNLLSNFNMKTLPTPKIHWGDTSAGTAVAPPVGRGAPRSEHRK